MIVPVVLAALADVGDRLDAATRRSLLAAAAIGSVALAATAGLALHDKQWAGQHGVDAVETAAAASPDAVVIATDGNAGRRSWPHAVDGDEWFLTDGQGALTDLSAALVEEDRSLVVSTIDEDAAMEVLEDRYEVVDRLVPDPDSPRVILSLVPR